MRSSTKLIGACCNIGQQKLGVESAPHIMQKFYPKKKIEMIQTEGSGFYKALFDHHNECLENNNVITIGGDHSISLATVASAAASFGPDLNVVWIDAHADIHTRVSSETKNVHGMPVASLLGHDNLFNFPEIKEHQLTYVGLRDVDEYEQLVLDFSTIRNYDMSYIGRHSIEKVADTLSNIDGPIHVSFDVDSIDPLEFASTGTPVKNGLSMADVWKILGALRDKTVSTDFVEFNPYISPQICEPSRDAYILFELIEFMSDADEERGPR